MPAQTIAELVYIDATGYHYADYPAFLAWITAQYQSIYGDDVYLEADSMDGQFLAIVAQAFYDTAVLGASVYNSFSPLTAQGVGLSRVVKINGLTRNIPSYSTAVLTIVGINGTVITNGVAQDSLGQLWNLPTTVTIPGGGTIAVTATSQVIGFITAASNSITKIYTPTQGWQTVNNDAAATPGAPVEADSGLRQRDEVSTANPSLTVFEGTLGAVANVSGVTKVSDGYENDTGSTDANGIPAHTISVVVAGGANADVAQAIQVHKTPGTGTAGDTTVLVYDSHGVPINIKFQRAVTATIGVQISLTKGVGWTDDYLPLIKDAVAAVINAGGIGKTVLYTKLFAPSYLPAPAGLTYDVTDLQIQIDSGGFAAANIDLDYDQNPVCDPLVDVVIIAS